MHCVGFFAFGTILFAGLLLHPLVGQASYEIISARTGWALFLTKFLAYAWFVFVESFGLFFLALFWAIASDTTQPDSAKQGFYVITALGQFGGILFPWAINRLPKFFELQTNSLSVFLCSLIISACWWSMYRFFKNTPEANLVSYKGANEDEVVQHHEPGFLEGIKLLGRTPYLLAIFAVISAFEIIMAIFDFHFQIIAAATYQGTSLAEFHGMYGSLVNFATLCCLLGGSSNITKWLGIRLALCIMPLFMIGALFGFLGMERLFFLTSLMIGCKAMNDGLNGPAIKQLYIPTTKDVRFKAQAWIEAFGYHGSKQGGSVFNMALKPLQQKFGTLAGRAYHVMLSTYLSLALISVGFFLPGT